MVAIVAKYARRRVGGFVVETSMGGVEPAVASVKGREDPTVKPKQKQTVLRTLVLEEGMIQTW